MIKNLKITKFNKFYLYYIWEPMLYHLAKIDIEYKNRYTDFLPLGTVYDQIDYLMARQTGCIDSELL